AGMPPAQMAIASGTSSPFTSPSGGIPGVPSRSRWPLYVVVAIVMGAVGFGAFKLVPRPQGARSDANAAKSVAAPPPPLGTVASAPPPLADAGAATAPGSPLATVAVGSPSPVSPA